MYGCIDNGIPVFHYICIAIIAIGQKSVYSFYQVYSGYCYAFLTNCSSFIFYHEDFVKNSLLHNTDNEHENDRKVSKVLLSYVLFRVS